MKTIFKPHSTVLFQGDSITDWGREGGALTEAFPGGGPFGFGYVSRAVQLYKILFPENPVTFVNRGVSGNRTKDLLDRYEEDILKIQPDYLSIMIGINDTWRRYDSQDPTSAEEYEHHYRELLTRIRKQLPDTRLMLIEPFLIPSDPAKDIFWEDLESKIPVVQKLALEFADVYLPSNGIFTNCILSGMDPKLLSEDSVHLLDAGSAVLAKEWLKYWASIE